MRVSWGYQFADSPPDELRERGPATEAEALAALHEFPWAEQQRQLTARRRAGLTSTLPGLWLRRADETLRLLAPDATSLLVQYQHGGQLYFRYLSLNWHDDHPLPDEPIQAFFAGPLAEWSYWEAREAAPPPPPELLRYAAAARPLGWRAVRTVGLEALGIGLALGLGAVAMAENWLWLLADLVPLVVLWAKLQPQWQHARLAAGQHVEVDLRARRLTLHDRHGTLSFGREEVRACVIGRSTPGRYVFWESEYVAFILESGQVCVIPGLTAPATALADALNVQYRVEPGSGLIHHRRRSTTELVAHEAQDRQLMPEFARRFAQYSTAELQAIVAQPERYTRPAVTAAAQLLRQRSDDSSTLDHG